MAKTLKTIDDLLCDDKNANKHTQRGVGMTQASIQQYGYGDSLTVDKNGKIISGNSRAEILADVKMLDAIVVQSDGTRPIIHQRTDLDLDTDKRARLLSIAMNRTHEVSLQWDATVLSDLIAEDVDLSPFFFDDELAALLASVNEQEPEGLLPDADADAIPENVETRCKPGDIWQLGRHRLLCGDSTNATDVERLMDGKRAETCFTSPPYNAGENASLSGNTHTTDSMYVGGIKDNKSQSGFAEFLYEFTTMALSCCDFVFVNIQSLAGNKIALAEYQYQFRQNLADVLIWNKLQSQPAMAEKVVNSQFEYILVFSPVSNPTRAIGTRDFRGTVSNVYDAMAQRNNEFSEVHGATFPVHLPEWVMENFTNPGNSVYDPFCGTGTTLIAAEQKGRNCYAMELEPKYCDVILTRWETCTGKTAELINGSANKV